LGAELDAFDDPLGVIESAQQQRLAKVAVVDWSFAIL
jgi:hypothetical protein